MDIPNLPINLGTIAAVLYALLYILMEPVAGMVHGLLTVSRAEVYASGALCAPLIIGGVAVANYLTHTYGMIATSIALGVHVFSWIIQFVGHGKFEGRAPALLDNLVQALFLAPFFVWFELLFWVGYRPELKARLEKSIQQNIREFKLSKDKAGLNGSADDKAS